MEESISILRRSLPYLKMLASNEGGVIKIEDSLINAIRISFHNAFVQHEKLLNDPTTVIIQNRDLIRKQLIENLERCCYENLTKLDMPVIWECKITTEDGRKYVIQFKFKNYTREMKNGLICFNYKKRIVLSNLLHSVYFQ